MRHGTTGQRDIIVNPALLSNSRYLTATVPEAGRNTAGPHPGGGDPGRGSCRDSGHCPKEGFLGEASGDSCWGLDHGTLLFHWTQPPIQST